MRARFLAVLTLFPLLPACGGVYQRSRDTVSGWLGKDDASASAPACAAPAPPPQACAPPPLSMPVPPPMDDEATGSPDRPIPAPSGPPPSVVAWPPRPPFPEAAAPSALGSGGQLLHPASGAVGLPADVLDVAGARAWTTIVLHHSASKLGGAVRFDQWHRAKGSEGVHYHFVIGNGTDTADGAIESTYRWRDQKDGEHAKGWDELSIGICLVGNFDETDPSPAQMDSLRMLVRALRGRFAIPRERVMGHGQLNATACPGKRFSARTVAAATDPTPLTGRGP